MPEDPAPVTSEAPQRKSNATDQARGERHHEPLTVWVLTDGRAGHESQSLGLVRALERIANAELHLLPALGPAALAPAAIGRLPAPWREVPAPHLLVAAGHRTHLSLLTARRLTGARAIVIMKPTLPVRWFDLCIVPQHDEINIGVNIIQTRGAINMIAPGCAPVDSTHDAELQSSVGLFLIGGPSRRHAWDDEAVIGQIKRIIDADPSRPWRLTTSRRTPATFIPQLEARLGDRIETIPTEKTPRGWVAKQLMRAGVVWVTEDSVSMIYESLTAGAAVGLLAVPRRSIDSIIRGIDDLADRGMLRTFEQWTAAGTLAPPREPLAEADRCAAAVIDRWFPARAAANAAP